MPRIWEGISSLFSRHMESAAPEPAPEPIAPDITRPMPFYWDEAGDLHADAFRALAKFRDKFNRELCEAQRVVQDRFAPGSPERRARSAILGLAHTAFNRTADAIDKELEVMIDVARGIDGIKAMALGPDVVKAKAEAQEVCHG